MKLICSQPSTLYSEWQLLVLIQNLRKFEGSIELDVIMLGDNIASLDKASNIFPWLRIFYYKDDIQRNRSYLPNNKIFGYINHWNKYPELEDKYMLFIDADSLLIDIPIVPKNNIHYGDDITEYIPRLKKIEELVYFDNNSTPIGLCYYGKGYTQKFWESVYIDSYKLINSNYKFPKWVSEMRSWFYNFSKFGFETSTHSELICGNGVKFSNKIYHHTETLYINKTLYKDKYPWDITKDRIPESVSSILYYNAIVDCKNNLLKLL